MLSSTLRKGAVQAVFGKYRRLRPNISLERSIGAARALKVCLTDPMTLWKGSARVGLPRARGWPWGSSLRVLPGLSSPAVNPGQHVSHAAGAGDTDDRNVVRQEGQPVGDLPSDGAVLLSVLHHRHWGAAVRHRIAMIWHGIAAVHAEPT